MVLGRNKSLIISSVFEFSGIFMVLRLKWFSEKVSLKFNELKGFDIGVYIYYFLFFGNIS